MPNWCENTLMISGPGAEIKKFHDGLLKVDDEYHLLSSYLPCPQELLDTESGYFSDIGYDVFFNPDPVGFMKVLEYAWVREQGIETREQLKEFIKNSYPGCYENGLKVNNNLFKFGYRSWFDWCNANWGTKWDAVRTVLIDQSPTHLIFRFDSAWCPPMRGLDQIAALFPELDFSINFFERGMNFQGFSRWTMGKRIDECTEEMDWPEDMMEEEANDLNGNNIST